MHIAFLTEEFIKNPDDLKRSFSGISYGIISELRAQGHEVTVVAAIQPGPRALVTTKALALLGRTVYRGKNLKSIYHPAVLSGLATSASRRVDGGGFDLLFTHSSLIAARMNTDIPVVLWRGAHYAALTTGYRGYQNLPPVAERWAHEQERAAMSHAAMNIFAADAACTSAHDIYNIPVAKLKVIPYGANLHPAPETQAVMHNIGCKRNDGVINFLFFGVDWYRKGGDRVVHALTRLALMGLRVHLDIVGVDGAEVETVPGFTTINHGYLHKSNPEQFKTMNHILKQAHFLIHPARGEAFGVVLCEAFACGIPVLATPVDGLPTIVDDNVNGILIDEPFDPEVVAARLMPIIANMEAYRKLAYGALNKYQRRLNWATAIQEFVATVEPLVTSRTPT